MLVAVSLSISDVAVAQPVRQEAGMRQEQKPKQEVKNMEQHIDRAWGVA